MKKICKKISTIVLITCLSLPLVACSFNIYFKSAVTTIIKDYANQTSSLIKSLILSKEIKTDTSQTISDALKTSKNISIKNPSNNTNLNNWNELEKLWGYNEKIETEGFNPNEYFVKSGEGERTKQVNSYQSTNNVFSKVNLILGINLIDNRKLYSLYKDTADVRNLITDFLNLTKETDSKKIPENSKAIINLLKNIILGSKWKEGQIDENAFKNTIINPIDSLLDYLIDVKWTKNKQTPSNNDDLKEFMTNWKDENQNPYSQWTTSDNWSLKSDWYKNWDSEYYNFYRAGTLINYTFFKIGQDYQIKAPKKSYKDRFLGDILSEYISITSGGIEQDKLLADLQQYLPHLLENPQYILLLAQAIVPILKQWGIKMKVNDGLENLSFGKTRSDNSSNIGDIFENINNLLNNPEELEYVLESLFGFDSKVPAYAFTYDIKLKILLLGSNPLPELYTIPVFGGKIKDGIKELIKNLTNTISSNQDIKNGIKTVINIYNQWSNQETNKGYTINLKALKNFLTATEGILTIINKDLIPVLKKIILNPKSVDDEEYFAFYEALGGQKAQKDQEAPINFRNNSLIDLLKKKINETNEPLSQIIFILLGNSNEKNDGVFKYIVDSNNAWIYDNYSQYFTNTKYFKITNASITNIENEDIVLKDLNNLEKAKKITLTYKFIYTINNHKYYFDIHCISTNENTKDKNFTGTKQFYFQKIKLTKIEEIN